MNYNIKVVLDEMLLSRGKSRYWLSKETGIHYKTIDSYYKNKIKRYEADSILKICLALDCEVGDIIKIVKC
ncbi:MAG: helix-turn-helix transcriptional regulator [Clostridia bacterium]|nr:helix-turn-helix transcriptional regulator [Clostridia bacterium]